RSNRFTASSWPSYGALVSATTKFCDVRCGWIGVFLDRRQVFMDGLERGSRYPGKHSCDDEILVGVHLDVVDLRVPRHWRVGREDARLPLRSGAGRLNVGKVDAPLFPARRDEVRTDKAQEAFAMPHRALAEQDIGLVHAVN